MKMREVVNLLDYIKAQMIVACGGDLEEEVKDQGSSRDFDNARDRLNRLYDQTDPYPQEEDFLDT